MLQHTLDAAEALAVVHGRRIERDATTAATVAGVDRDGRLVAVLERTGAWLKPVTVFMTPDEVGPVAEETVAEVEETVADTEAPVTEVEIEEAVAVDSDSADTVGKDES